MTSKIFKIYALVLLLTDSTAMAEMRNKDKTAIFAGGCFWCIEADFEKLDGVTNVVSGYSGGAADTANYKTVTYTETGHYEVVQVSYNPTIVSYSDLVEYFWRHIDPTNPDGQFCDKGSSYRSAIFYADELEKQIALSSLDQLNKNKTFSDAIVTAIEPAKPFYLAEEYHQDYYKKNPIRYRFYRNGCGRDKRVRDLWGK
ncbi:MAG: peptide-methionine (S)-S-oxide reductase MsrA [Gammaproteobacteria bacterium]|nr:peptide-methionine (S)-S-oxide reductase MsrA [Gammaproteobacteria bacterium]